MATDNLQDLKIRDNKALKRAEIETVISRKEKLLNVLFAFLLGIIFDYLFYLKTPGVSHPVFTTFIIAFFTYSTRDRIKYHKGMGLVLLCIIFLLSLNLMVHSNIFLNFLNFMGIPFLIVAYTILVTNEKSDLSKLAFITDMIERIFILALSNIFKPFVFIKQAVSRNNNHEKNKTKKNILIGLGISLPILMFVIPLLASADMAFGYYMKNISNVFDMFNIKDVPAHIILVLIIFLYVFGYAWSFKHSDEEKSIVSNDRHGFVDQIIIITVLIVINLVYLLFTIVQFSYLYGGAKNILPDGFTYAEYARRGFFELVTVTIINFIILLISMKVIKKDNKILNNIVNIFSSLLVVFTFNMLFAAHYKLSLYEESFGFTELRIYVHTFMLLMCVLFIIILIRIWYPKVPVFKASFIAALVIYVILNYINVDKIIARENIDRYYKTGKIDATYITSLSYDAVPEIIKLMDDKNVDISQEVKEGLKREYDTINRNYKWMEYNYSRSMAQKILRQYFGTK